MVAAPEIENAPHYPWYGCACHITVGIRQRSTVSDALAAVAGPLT